MCVKSVLTREFLGWCMQGWCSMTECDYDLGMEATTPVTDARIHPLTHYEIAANSSKQALT